MIKCRRRPRLRCVLNSLQVLQPHRRFASFFPVLSLHQLLNLAYRLRDPRCNAAYISHALTILQTRQTCIDLAVTIDLRLCRRVLEAFPHLEDVHQELRIIDLVCLRHVETVLAQKILNTRKR
jgi:hypothetical protein